MKHGRKDRWTKDAWLDYKRTAVAYYTDTMARVRRLTTVIREMQDRED